jgi:AraC-like DNA-binding protein
MLNEFMIIASLCGITLGLTACSIFLFSNRTHVHANRLLALTLFCLVVIMAVTFLFEWKVDYYAYVYRFPSPLFYLFLPAAYLYLRSALKDEHRFRKWDWLHFLPAVLHLAEMLPFYFTSYVQRQALVRQVALDPDRLIALDEGMLPPYYHTALRFVQGSIYVYFMFRLLWKNKAQGTALAERNNSLTFNWLVNFTWLIAVLAFPLIFFFLFPKMFFVQGTRFLLLVISVSFLVINLYLFFRPQILYGISRVVYDGGDTASLLTAAVNRNGTTIKKPVDVSPGSSEPALTISFSLEHYKPVLEKYMAEQQPFLKPGYSIGDLSSETGIPLHHLSALLNRVYEMRFTDFLNRMRINYIRENSGNPDWDLLTLEGIAKVAGFNSRTTFFNAIKKTTGLTPSEFMASVKNEKRLEAFSMDQFAESKK